MKLSAEQRVQRAHVALMNDPRYCLYSGIFMVGKVAVEDNVPTAYTNGRDVKYGRKFVNGLTDEELRGLILHENLHKAFRHLTTWQDLWKQDARKANMACDFVINLMIYDSDPAGKFVKLPEGGCFDEKYRGMDAGTVFRLLQSTGGNGGGGGDEPLDEHGWDDATEMSQEEQRELANEIDQALRQGKILAGKMNGNVPREVSEALESKVDWREVMRDFIKSQCTGRDESTWRRPARRWIGQDVYMPSMISTRVGRIGVFNDMSGSIDDVLVGQFLGELKNICEVVRPEAIELMYWDTQICQHETYETADIENIMQSTKPRGGGGTDPRCIPQYLHKKKLQLDCAIVLTDGVVGSWGENWPCPVLWGITTNGITADVGKSVAINL